VHSRSIWSRATTSVSTLVVIVVYLQAHPDSALAINLKSCNHFRLYNGKAAEAELKVKTRDLPFPTQYFTNSLPLITTSLPLFTIASIFFTTILPLCYHYSPRFTIISPLFIIIYNCLPLFSLTFLPLFLQRLTTIWPLFTIILPLFLQWLTTILPLFTIISLCSTIISDGHPYWDESAVYDPIFTFWKQAKSNHERYDPRPPALGLPSFSFLLPFCFRMRTEWIINWRNMPVLT
jgi:hypothetical protein